MSALGLRGRLTLLYGGLVLIAGIISLVAIYLVVDHRLDEEFSGDDLNSRLALLREQGEHVSLPDGSTVPIDQLIAEARADQEAVKDAALDVLILQGGIAVLAVGLLAGAIGWVVAGRGLRPLEAVAATAQRIATSRGVERDLRERIATGGRADDIQRLATSFNAMLDKLDRAFDVQRRFVANASHELRTPLALERAVLELESTKPGLPAETRHVFQSLLAINERHTRLIDGLLMLADSANEIASPEPVDLAEVADQVVAMARAGAAEAQISVESDLGEAIVLGDPVMLEHLVRNLVENAIRHNHPGGWVKVAAGMSGKHADLRVSNSGAAIREGDLPRLVEPYWQADKGGRSGERGFGLGLSIVKAIVEAHAGKLDLAAPVDGGLEVTAGFPRSSS